MHRAVRRCLATRVRQGDGAEATSREWSATFGTIKRGTKRQLTINGLPAYTYHHDPAGVVLCDNVDGWFAVRPL